MASDAEDAQARRCVIEGRAVERIILKSNQRVEQWTTAHKLLEFTQADMLVSRQLRLTVLQTGEEAFDDLVRSHAHSNRDCIDEETDHLRDMRQLRRPA